jgi:peptidoglycan-associated lipoprotein
MNARLRPAAVFLLLFALGLGCAKKPPRSAAQAPPSTPPAESVEPAAVAPPDDDPTEGALPSDIQELNAELARRGLLGDVHFAFDRATLDEAARERLARNAGFLKEHGELLVSIEGHCDERGTHEYNLALGERRSASARDYLVSLAVGAERLRTMSYGEERPQCETSDEDCWARNRRAHFVVTGRSGAD